MILGRLFEDRNTAILKKIMDFSAENQNVIANNIANAETPNFTAKKLEFSEAFRDAVNSGDVDSVENVEGKVVNNYDNPYRSDMNNVDVEKELLELEENRIRYETVGVLLKRKLTKFRKIVEGLRD